MPMTPALSAQQLLALVHQYYPAGLTAWDDGYSESEQYQRLIRARQEALQNSGLWDRLLSKLTGALPDCKVEDWSVLFSDDNCWRTRVYLPEAQQYEEGEREVRAVVVLVSVLAPVYVRYSSFDRRRAGGNWGGPEVIYEDVPETKSYADKVEALVRAELNVQPLCHETLFTRVPDIQCRNAALGKAQLIDCLFTDDRW